MKCPICKKKISHVRFEIDPPLSDPGRGTAKVDASGKIIHGGIEWELLDDDLTGVDPDPVLKCPECKTDITEHIENADEFRDLDQW